MSRRAVFLDRDGTLNIRPRPHDYVRTAADFAWIPGARGAAARLANAGYVLAVVSNQRGVARGLVSDDVLSEIERRIQDELAELGCRIDAFRYCRHELDAACGCRKPAPGMLLELAREFDLDTERSWIVGDSEEDVLAGQAAGCRTALVGARPERSRPDVVAESLAEASGVIARR